MATKDFTITFIVDQTPEQVFNAVNNVRAWWSQALKGDSKQLNDEFEYQHKEFHYSRHRLVEVVPNKRVVWLTTGSSLSFIKQKGEWNGTRVCFDISEVESKTHLQFTHVGLVPQIECFGACSGGWSHYLNKSLLPLITTGVGMPDPVEEGRSAADLVGLFYTALVEKNEQGIASIIADNIVMSSPFHQASGAREFIDGLQRWLHATKTYTVLKQFEDGGDVCVISKIDAQTPAGEKVTWETSDWYTISKGKISGIKLYFDPRVWSTAMGI